MSTLQPTNHIPEAKKMVPGDDTHLTLLMAPVSLNFVTGKDREQLLAYGRAAFEAGRNTAEQGKCLHQIAEPALSSAQSGEQAQAVAYLDVGVGGYLDLGSDLTNEQLSALPKGRHALAICGTFGIDGFVPATNPAPAPAPALEVERDQNYQRGFKDGYGQRDAEIKGALV